MTAGSKRSEHIPTCGVLFPSRSDGFKAMSTVLITGVSSGLGRELAKLYAREDHDLVLVARRRDQLERLKCEIESVSLSRVIVVAADLSQPKVPEEIYAHVQSLGLQVDVLVNNAGFGVYGEFLTTDFDKISAMYQVNLFAPMRLMKLFLPAMIDRNFGHVINVASIGSFFPGPWMAAYFGAKADLYSFVQALDREIKGSSVLLTMVCPGPFLSGFQQTAFGQDRNRAKEHRLPSAQETVRDIFVGIAAKQKLIIPGYKNQWIYWLSRVLPKAWVIELVHRAQRQLDIPSHSLSAVQ